MDHGRAVGGSLLDNRAPPHGYAGSDGVLQQRLKARRVAHVRLANTPLDWQCFIRTDAEGAF